MSEPVIKQKQPYPVEVKEGESIAWCACGRSNKDPKCDGSHAKQNTGLSPKVVKMEKTGTVYLCGCKHTKNPPFCDGTHTTL